MSAVRIIAALSILALISACGANDAPNSSEGNQPIEDKDGLRYIATGLPDADGCQAYRRFAPGRLTVQVIYYRKANGRFTVNKSEADCEAN